MKDITAERICSLCCVCFMIIGALAIISTYFLTPSKLSTILWIVCSMMWCLGSETYRRQLEQIRKETKNSIKELERVMK